MPIERVITQRLPDEERFLTSLRPQKLDACIGQDVVRNQLRIALDAAMQRGEPLDHVLLDGPPGLGKTTLAHVIANELGANIRVTSGPAIVRQGDLMSLLTQLETGDVLFVDEIHRLAKVVEEFLYPALEDFRVDYTTESGIGGRTINFALKRFTLIGATTRAGMLSPALRSRFTHVFHLKWYTPDELTHIVARSAELLGVRSQPDALRRLASRARGTPRIVNNLLKRVRDYAQVRGDGVLTLRVVDTALDTLEIDGLGLDALDRAYLATLLKHYDGGPAGIEAIAASMGHERDTLEDMVEPFLLQIGFIIRTPRGRLLRPAAYAHLGVQPPRQPDQATLFGEGA
ncbi:MAG: Holliday junction branch migration DNA helicase RuvB [Phycisphaerae bacterium]|jgi:Holliday junction DNA helicase RuvB|nr:Holliday junction branch migration DNA helicase RuvB [Phycisphaerae bacterium]MCZ2400488.1 Holliday junction branch migration DNA helicase RuvB [Phycisphaerae bacterium]